MRSGQIYLAKFGRFNGIQRKSLSSLPTIKQNVVVVASQQQCESAKGYGTHDSTKARNGRFLWPWLNFLFIIQRFAFTFTF
jgi:hypothetical protein